MSEKSKQRRRLRWSWRMALGILALLLVVACIGGVIIGGRQYIQAGAEPPELATITLPVERRDLVQSVQLNGALEPRDRAKVNFDDGVRVNAVLVAEGQRVRKGEVVARLETRDLELKVASARAQVEQAEQAINELTDEPDQAELAQAAAKVARARADLLADEQDLTDAEIANARDALELARQKLADLEAGILPDALRSADDQLRAAQDELIARQESMESIRESASRAKTGAEQAMIEGAQALEKAQRTYSDTYWDWDFVQRTGRDPRIKEINSNGNEVNKKLEDYEIEEYRRKFVDAETEVRNAEAALESLKNAYEVARKDELREIDSAGRALEASQRALEQARQEYEQQSTRGLAEEVLTARKAVADAEKAYRELVDNPDRPARRAELEAALLEAIAAQEKLLAGPKAADMAEAQANLERARAEQATAERALEEANLRAPIDGTVVDITLQAGTTAASNDAISIADLSSFLIRGEINEQDIADVTAGLPVEVSVDSVPGETFRGKVVRVEELPREQSDATAGGGFGSALGGLYPVEVEIESGDRRLRVGMATTVDIEIFSIADTLVVPIQAVQYDEQGNPFVLRATGANDPAGQPLSERVMVEVGASSEDSIEIMSGLAEGDEVVLQQLPPMEVGPPGVFVQ